MVLERNQVGLIIAVIVHGLCLLENGPPLKSTAEDKQQGKHEHGINKRFTNTCIIEFSLKLAKWSQFWSNSGVIMRSASGSWTPRLARASTRASYRVRRQRRLASPPSPTSHFRTATQSTQCTGKSSTILYPCLFPSA